MSSSGQGEQKQPFGHVSISEAKLLALCCCLALFTETIATKICHVRKYGVSLAIASHLSKHGITRLNTPLYILFVNVRALREDFYPLAILIFPTVQGEK